MSTRATAGALMVIGGGEDKEGEMEILREFVRLSRGPGEARIVVMSAASTDHDAVDARYREAFGRLGVAASSSPAGIRGAWSPSWARRSSLRNCTAGTRRAWSSPERAPGRR
jgi:hypothetical protein